MFTFLIYKNNDHCPICKGFEWETYDMALDAATRLIAGFADPSAYSYEVRPVEP